MYVAGTTPYDCAKDLKFISTDAMGIARFMLENSLFKEFWQEVIWCLRFTV
jgi:hypothetical protein